MKILLAVDGSSCSNAAVWEVVTRPWPPGTQVKVLSVIHALPFVPDPMFVGVGMHYYSLELEQKRAHRAVLAATKELAARAPQLDVTSCPAVEGPPASHIVDEARRWDADLIVIGSHGHGAAARLVLGSVSHAVVLHAPCSVEVVRERTVSDSPAAAS
jgi:nucleotide-binding universal stress UspA family protein